MSSKSGARRGYTILVVDDEPALLALVGTMLWRAGYEALEASGPSEALRICAEHPEPIQLLLTDVLMPDMNGYELAERVKAVRPEVKVLFMSGYTDRALVESIGRPLSGDPLVRKPFTQYKLLTQIAETLGAPSAAV